MPKALLGLDVGTTLTKAVLFDLSGAELATAEQTYSLHAPQPGWAEQEPEDVWQAVLQVLRAVVEKAGERQRILAVALAAQSGSLIPAQADGTPLYPMITWMDGRARDLVQEWRAQGLAKVRRISGWPLHPGLPLPSIAWLRRFRPDVFAASERYLSANDFLVHRLTGRFCTDFSCGAEMQLLDVNTGQWSRELCDLAGVSPDQLSPLRPAGTIVGPIRPEVSRLTGLPAGTPVVNGGQDQSCTALALGMTSPGRFLLACGTAWVITTVVETPALDSVPAGMALNFHVVPKRWTVSQSLGGLGASLEWWLNQCWQRPAPHAPATRAEMYAALNNALEQTRPGCEGLLFLPPAGEQQRGGFIGLRLDHTRADMGRAIMEGAAFELRRSLTRIRQSGMPVERLWMVGGATRSAFWPAIVADAASAPLALAQYAHWPALGAAILAGVGVGAFETLEVGQARLRKSVRCLEPDEPRTRIYDERFAAYQQMVRIISQA